MCVSLVVEVGVVAVCSHQGQCRMCVGLLEGGRWDFAGTGEDNTGDILEFQICTQTPAIPYHCVCMK